MELGAQWPPAGIEPVNPFELPLLNTVNLNAIDIFYISIAVWVGISLYTFIMYIKFNSYFRLFYFLHTIFMVAQPPSLKPKSKMHFSTNNNLDVEFYKWFSGFTDAEGTFMIVSLAKGFSFKFSIGLHIDDLNVLNYIRNKLGFGRVYSSGNTCHFNVTKKDDILKLISIFDIYLLNSTKRFNYLDLKKSLLFVS